MLLQPIFLPHFFHRQITQNLKTIDERINFSLHFS